MAAEEEVNELIKQFQHIMPKHFLTKVDHINAGVGQILRYLSVKEEPVSAGEISSFMNVSTARVAVLIRRMEENGLIKKESDPSDARKTLVRLSPKGLEVIEARKREFTQMMSRMIDRVGAERMKEFVEVAGEIHKIAAEYFHEKQQKEL